MKKFKINSLILLGLMLFSVTPSYATNLKNLAMFGLGFASGTVFHEVGHATTIWAQGGRVKAINFQSTEFEFKNTRNLNKKLQITALTGYAAQSLASEVILQNKNWHKNDYALGWMTLGIFTNLSNPIRYYVFGQTDNDLGFYKNSGGNPLIPAIFMVAHAGFTLHRVFSDTDIPVYLGNNTFGFNFKF
ncbi:hypothetical protein DID76_03065 [Candidatus Marinamargulisbacteria bacterium SCGC AG-414-C22]|nr:hypothetical protein DID76_03065 [Candidatus Marinamargulisbacteria bacterium SCGC AG-414-C22]